MNTAAGNRIGMICVSDKLIRTALVCLLVCTGTARAWSRENPAQDTLIRQYNTLYQQATAYDELSLYAPCIEKLTQAIQLATRYELEEERIRATIRLAEMLRKTGEYEQGRQLLVHLEGAARFPKLHVRKLGRMAAIYSEGNLAGEYTADSVMHYLNTALTLATELDMAEEKAGIYNQLGYLLYASERERGLDYLLRSAELYQALGDTHNYVGVKTNMLRCHMLYHDSAAARSVIDELVPLVESRPWYTAQMELYSIVASFYSVFGQDPLAVAYWSSLKDKSIILNLQALHSAQMNALRTLYATQQLRTRMAEIEGTADHRKLALERQTRRTRELIIYLTLMALLMIGVVALLFRERKLKRRLADTNAALQLSNEKYQLLMVESNHRIKNNLQMVISMLEYHRQRPVDDDRDIIKSMLGKIQTISMLHKHLSAEGHNAPVGLDRFFQSIIESYGSMSSGLITVESQVPSLLLPSERIVYFGLILNEMLANTLEHRTAGNEKIMVTVSAYADGYRFEYRDGSRHEVAAAKGMGSQLIRQLIDRVGGKDFRFDPNTGHYQFQFYG